MWILDRISPINERSITYAGMGLIVGYEILTVCDQQSSINAWYCFNKHTNLCEYIQISVISTPSPLHFTTVHVLDPIFRTPPPLSEHNFTMRGLLLPNAMFHYKIWDCSNRIITTNNATEGINNRFNQDLSGNIGVMNWIKKFNRMETQFRLEYIDMKREGINLRRKEYVDRDMARKQIIDEMERLEV